MMDQIERLARENEALRTENERLRKSLEMDWNKPTRSDLLACLDKWERLVELGLVDYTPESARGLAQRVADETSDLMTREFGKKERKA